MVIAFGLNITSCFKQQVYLLAGFSEMLNSLDMSAVLRRLATYSNTTFQHMSIEYRVGVTKQPIGEYSMQLCTQ